MMWLSPFLGTTCWQDPPHLPPSLSFAPLMFDSDEPSWVFGPQVGEQACFHPRHRCCWCCCLNSLQNLCAFEPVPVTGRDNLSHSWSTSTRVPLFVWKQWIVITKKWICSALGRNEGNLTFGGSGTNDGGGLGSLFNISLLPDRFIRILGSGCGLCSCKHAGGLIEVQVLKI